MQTYISTGALVGVQLDEQRIASIISDMRPGLRSGDYPQAMSGAVVGIGLAVSTAAPDYHDYRHDGDYGRDYDYSSEGGALPPHGDYSYGHDYSYPPWPWHDYSDYGYAGGDSFDDDTSAAGVIVITVIIIACVCALPLLLIGCTSKPSNDPTQRHQLDRPTRVRTVNRKLRQLQLDAQV